MTEKELLAVACEQFLGKNVQDIKNVVLQTLEGHLLSILGTLTVEQIYQDQDQLASWCAKLQPLMLAIWTLKSSASPSKTFTTK